MNYNSKRGVQIMDSLHNMLTTIAQISKNTQNFDQLQQLLPFITDLRKSDADNKQLAQSLKTISEIVPKIKGKILPNNRGNDSASQVYERMINHLNFELNKLNTEFQDINTKSSEIKSCQQEQIKCQTTSIIKQVQQLLASSKKVVMGSINQKRKQYLNESNHHHYLYRAIQQKLKKNTSIRQKLEQCKYEFGQSRNIYNLYEANNQSSQLKADIQKLENGKETGINEALLKNLQAKIQIQKRKSFISKSEEHLQKQYPFVLTNLQKLSHQNNHGKYEQNLFHHYYGWGKRLKILLQAILIKVSSFDKNKLNIKQEQSLVLICKDHLQKYQKMLNQLIVYLQ